MLGKYAFMCRPEPEFYGNMVYKCKKLIGRNEFSFPFRKISIRTNHKRYNLNVMRHPACLVFNPITVDNYDSFFNCTPVGRASDAMMSPTKLFLLVGPGASILLLDPPGFNWCFFLVLQIIGDVVWYPGISITGHLIESVSPRFSFIMVVLIIYLFVLDDSLTG